MSKYGEEDKQENKKNFISSLDINDEQNFSSTGPTGPSAHSGLLESLTKSINKDDLSSNIYTNSLNINDEQNFSFTGPTGPSVYLRSLESLTKSIKKDDLSSNIYTNMHEALKAEREKMNEALNAEREKMNEALNAEREKISKIKEDMVKIDSKIQNMEQNSYRMIEIIGLLAAVISFIMASVNIIAKAENLFTGLVLLLALAAGLVIFASLVHLFFSDTGANTKWTLIITGSAFLLIIALIILSCPYIKDIIIINKQLLH